jgi:flagellar motor component MotA
MRLMRLLAAIGRFAVALAAILMVIGGGIGGYVGAARQAGFETAGSVFPSGPVTASEIGSAIVGAILGLLAAGVIFGPLAALFDIRENVAILAGRRQD